MKHSQFCLRKRNEPFFVLIAVPFSFDTSLLKFPFFPRNYYDFSGRQRAIGLKPHLSGVLLASIETFNHLIKHNCNNVLC